MQNLVFLIFFIVVIEWIWGNKKVVDKEYVIVTRSHDYYKKSAILNMLLSKAGIISLNLFIRGKDIIPEWSVWVCFVGFIFMDILAIYHVYKMLATTN